MQNKLFLFSKNVFEISKKMEEIEKSLLKAGFFDFSFFTYSNFEDFELACINAKNDCDNAICVCANEKIDELLGKIKSSNDTLRLVKEQAVQLGQNTTYRKMLFVPIELEFAPFLKEFVEEKEVFVYSIFGKSALYVKEKFGEINQNLMFEVLSKSTFLHTVFCNEEVDEDEISTKFGESCFAHSETNLADCCDKILKDKNMSLAVVESLTGGLVSGKLTKGAYVANVKDCFVLRKDKDFDKLALDEKFLNEHGAVSKETAFALAKNLLQKTQCDLALAVVGFDCDAGKSFVAVGNKTQIHVFSSTFYGHKEQILDNVSDFALFRLFRFLSEN